MKAAEFCYWLQGMFELVDPTTLNAEQTASIKKHLALAFKHEIDASYGNQAHQNELSEIHNGPSKPLLPGKSQHPQFDGPDVRLRC